MFGMSPETMLRMALSVVDLDNPESCEKIKAQLAALEFEPGEKEKVVALLALAMDALSVKIAH